MALEVAYFLYSVSYARRTATIIIIIIITISIIKQKTFDKLSTVEVN